MRDAIEALERAFVDYARGEAVNRPRSHTYTELGEGRHYLLKTMDGSLPRLGVHALRVTSDLTHEHDGRGDKIAAAPRGPRARPHEHGGGRDKIAAAPGGRYVGFVLVFDIERLVPVAIVHDGYL